MTEDVYEDFFVDFITEVNYLAMREDIWGDSPFDRGYQAGMFAVMKAVQDEIAAFNLAGKAPRRLIDVDEWFRLGKHYKFDLPG